MTGPAGARSEKPWRAETDERRPGGHAVQHRDANVAGGGLRVLSCGTGLRPLLAVHGLHRQRGLLAGGGKGPAELGSWTCAAADTVPHWPARYSFDQHIADLQDAVRVLGLHRPVLAGHSLCAYVVLLDADAYPEIFGRLVLVDGGLPLPVADLDQIRAGIGPSLAWLTQTYPLRRGLR